MTLPPSPAVRGFLPDDEGWHLHKLAQKAAELGPLLEIGSYCGRSTLWLAEAARAQQTVVFALDHHRGSEEHQVGEAFHNETLVDDLGQVDTLREFRRTISQAGLDEQVIAMVASTEQLGRHWQGIAFGLVFIDGGHSLEAALTDWRTFGQRVMPGGFLAIHDVFPDPATGGQAPYTVWRMALASGLYEHHSQCGSLRALRRLR